MSKLIGYGKPYLNIIHDMDGNEIAYRSSIKPLADLRVLVKFEATVSGHSEYKGVKRTEITELRRHKWED
jgi:hypothetical protein